MFNWLNIAYIVLINYILFNVNKGQDDLIEGSFVSEFRGVFLREHSLVRPYQSAGIEGSIWNIVGSTVLTDRQVRLTSDIQSLKGGVWNRHPCSHRDWELKLEFSVHGSTGSLFGDGLAFWYVKEPEMLGNVFGSKDHFIGLGIFLDTYSNHNGVHQHSHPYISAMVSNGSLQYDHDSDGTHTALGDSETGCEAQFRNKEYTTQILIRYVGNELSVYTDVIGEGVWKKCFKVPGVRLPPNYYFGVSAATGDLSDNHDVISIYSYKQEYSRVKQYGEDELFLNPYAENVAAPRDHINSPKPSRLGWFGTVLLIVIAILVIVFVFLYGLNKFQKRQEFTRKRFY